MIGFLPSGFTSGYKEHYPSDLETKTLGILFKIDFGLLAWSVFFLAFLFFSQHDEDFHYCWARNLKRLDRTWLKQLAGTVRLWVIQKAILIIHIKILMLLNPSIVYLMTAPSKTGRVWYTRPIPGTYQFFGYLFSRKRFSPMSTVVNTIYYQLFNILLRFFHGQEIYTFT